MVSNILSLIGRGKMGHTPQAPILKVIEEVLTYGAIINGFVVWI